MMSSLNSKPMRKGTRSCLECRRRKNRCIFPPGGSRKCVTCKSKGFSCTEQGRAALQDATTTDTRLTLAKLSSRVEELEAIIKSTGQSHHNVSVGGDLVTGVQASSEASKSPSEDTTTPISIRSLNQRVPAPATVPLPTQDPVSITPLSTFSSAGADLIDDIEPISSLFDNAIWSRNRAETELGTVAKEDVRAKADTALLQKRSHTRQQLLKVLPAPRLLSDILEATCFWWTTWRAIAPWVLDTLPDKCSETLSGFVTFTLSSNDPSLVGLGLLCIAASIQQLDSNHGVILRQLRSPPSELFHKYFSCVDLLILNDSHYASSMTGLGVGVLASKLLMNLGLIKKTWLVIHRSISYGQLLGLQCQQRLQNESEVAMSCRQQTWLYLCQMDLYTSLLIGLPYATNGSTIPNDLHGGRGTTSWFQSRLLRLSAQIIDRNQAGLGLSITLTQDLQRDAALAAYDMDQDFWDAPAELSLQRIDRSEYMERLTAQLWYHHIRVFIHMPLMVKSIENPELEDHRTACLTGSRETLKIYHIMRSDPLGAFSLVKMIDYQSFICATLLLLAILGLGSSPLRSQSFHHARDWELIESTLAILRQASTTSNDSIAAQAFQGLETLASLARSAPCPPPPNGQCQTPYAKIVVPFSGTITISPGSFFKCSGASSEQASLTVIPVFTLSNGSYETSQNQSSEPNHDMTVHGLESGLGDDSGEKEFPYIDFGWENIIGVNAEDDWGWLADAGLYNT
ncbi:hypothetical protein G7Y89_g9748 [Cudoniella acicularis]|uniref:Zn(2)-C6 fungal-type domain-containing protein n=1 Tax=Cudoniella acicularis TaxID=354080 RepID=A0A8H4VZQ5_9HELO|nr:hypothetical protein G7Y89_g9748 [Cudoniella acicularis]